MSEGKYPVFSRQPPSELAVLCFKGIIASVSGDCQACGRVLFSDCASDLCCYEPGEYDALLEKQQADPGKYISIGEVVIFAHILGKQICIDCPCNYLHFVEQLILDVMPEAMAYYRGHADAKKEAANSLEQAVAETEAIVGASQVATTSESEKGMRRNG